MDKENNSETNALRRERDDIIREKIKTYFSINSMQGTIQAKAKVLKRLQQLQSELELENRQLKEAVEADKQTKLNLGNDVENITRMAEIFSSHLAQLNNNLQGTEVHTENIKKSTAAIMNDINKYLDEQKFKEKYYMDEINKIESSISAEIDNNNKENEEMKLILDKQNEELLELTKEEEEATTRLEEQEKHNLQLESELQTRREETDSLQKEFSKLENKFDEAIDKHNINKSNYKTEIETLEIKIGKDKESIENMQKNIEVVKEKNKNIDEEISLVQSDLNNLETKHCDKEETVINLVSKSEELKLKLSQVREEKNSEIIRLQETLKSATEYNEKIIGINKEFTEKLEDKKKSMKQLKTELSEKQQEQEQIIKQLEETENKNKENSSDYKNTIKEFKKKITEAQLRNKQKTESNEELKLKNEQKQNEISNIKDKIVSTTDKKNTIIQDKISTIKNLKEELKSVKKERQTANSDHQRITKTKDKEIKSTEKHYTNHINKMEKEIKQHQEKIDTIIKNNKDKHIKETKSLEDSIKALEHQIAGFKAIKENLQKEMVKKLNDIVDVTTNKIEAKNNERTQNPPKPIIKSRTSFTASTPKVSLKKPAEKHGVLPEKEKQMLSPIENNYPLTQKSPKPETTLPKNKNITATQKSEMKEIGFLSPAPKWHNRAASDKKLLEGPPKKSWQSVNIWPSDHETTDDGLKGPKNKNLTQLMPPAVDPKKRATFDFFASEDENDKIFNSLKNNKETSVKQEDKKSLTQISKKRWDLDVSSDDSFFGKLEKSRKIQSAMKGSTNPGPAVNLDTSSD